MQEETVRAAGSQERMILMNAGTIFVLVLLIAVVCLIVRKMIRDKKAGRTCGSCGSCGGNCSHCPAAPKKAEQCQGIDRDF